MKKVAIRSRIIAKPWCSDTMSQLTKETLYNFSINQRDTKLNAYQATTKDATRQVNKKLMEYHMGLITKQIMSYYI